MTVPFFHKIAKHRLEIDFFWNADFAAKIGCAQLFKVL